MDRWAPFWFFSILITVYINFNPHYTRNNPAVHRDRGNPIHRINCDHCLILIIQVATI